ncbi:MAG: hypothetical protein ACK5HL_04940 [Bacilli bacterium]
METIKIAHLYYDCMNLYGENANVKILKSFLEQQEIKVQIHFLTFEDVIDFNKYDLFYIGMGNENSQKCVIDDLIKYRNNITDSIEKGKFFITTGNAFNIFGKKIKNLNGNIINCLNIFNYFSEENDKRIITEQIYDCPKINKKIIGYYNIACNIIILSIIYFLMKKQEII